MNLVNHLIKVSFKIFKSYIKVYFPLFEEIFFEPFLHIKECWFLIIEFLPKETIFNLSLVNKELNCIVYSHPKLWKSSCIKSINEMEKFLTFERFKKNLTEITIENEILKDRIDDLLKYNIKKLYLSNITLFKDQDLIKLSKLNLKVLYLNKLPLLTNKGMNFINYEKLNSLSIHYCWGIDNITYSKCRNIESLSLIGQLIKNNELLLFYNQKIKFLNLSKCSNLSENEILKLKNVIPNLFYDKKMETQVFMNKSYKTRKIIIDPN